MVGIPPFYCENLDEMYNRIQHATLKFPRDDQLKLSEEVKMLIATLLDRNPTKRPDFEKLKADPWFASLDWEKVYNQEYVPVFKPTITDPRKAENFDEEFTSEDAIHSVVPDYKMKHIQMHQYEFDDMIWF